ncbi:MAG: DegT/DnrJ/EryC1/StrS aminotransferase family protein [Deltaproteobacteria bacterium]|nr:DegT/DnrJ/EryC1/StrS aminotransferase family protein [Deltaproteobacteria bacterium]
MPDAITMPAVRHPFARALPTLSPEVLGGALQAAVGRARSRPFPLGAPGARWLFLGRNAVYRGLRALGLGAGELVLMPALHHGVEVEAALAAGVRVEFYPVDLSLQPDLDAVRRRMRSAGARVLYAIHFIGYPQPLVEMQAIAREAGAYLIEDCALALFSATSEGVPLGSVGDASIFSLYKTLPIPDGGVLWLAQGRDSLPEPRRPPWGSTIAEAGSSAISHAFTSGHERLAELLWAAVRRVRRHVDLRRSLGEAATGTNHLDPACLDLGISPFSRWLASGLDEAAACRIVERRRRNFERMAQALGDPALLALPAPLPVGTCPLFFPLLARDGAQKDHLLCALERAGIGAINFWRIAHPALVPADFPEATELRERIVEVPIHQDLDEEAVEQIVRVLKGALAASRRQRSIA